MKVDAWGKNSMRNLTQRKLNMFSNYREQIWLVLFLSFQVTTLYSIFAAKLMPKLTPAVVSVWKLLTHSCTLSMIAPLLTGEISFLIKLYPMTTCGRNRPYSTFHLSQGLMMPYVVTRGLRSTVNTMTKARSRHLRTPRIRTLRDRLDQQCQGLHRGRTTLTTVMVAPVLTISATTTNSTEPMTYSSSPMNSHHVYKSYKKMSSTTATRYVNSATTQPSFENGLLSWKE